MRACARSGSWECMVVTPDVFWAAHILCRLQTTDRSIISVRIVTGRAQYLPAVFVECIDRIRQRCSRLQINPD